MYNGQSAAKFLKHINMEEKSSTTIPYGSTLEKQGEKVAIFYFYVLIDPRDNKIKYVGRTVDINNRFRNHIYEAKKNNRNKRERWIISLLRRNMKPIMKVIYTLTCSLDEAIQTEKMLVKKLSKRFELKNEPDNYLGAILTGRKVYQYSLDGDFIKEFPNSNQAKISTGIHDAAIISNCKKVCNSAGGYVWSFHKVENVGSYNKNWRKEKGKPILVTTPSGEIIEYKTSRLASKELGIHWKRISAVLNNRQGSVKKYKFRFKD